MASHWVYRAARVASLFDWLAPPRCHFCGAPCPGNACCCAGCAAALPWNDLACRACAVALPAGGVCRSCLLEAPPQDLTWTAFRYEPPLPRQIQSLKFEAQLAPAQLLGELMAMRLARRAAPVPEVLVPVPLHPRRLRVRGYNQAQELGRVLARRLSLELRPDCARRLRATREQTALTATQRRRNLRGAFSVGAAVRGRHVALLDDVITTGTTVAELARAARRAGARRIEAWAVARA